MNQSSVCDLVLFTHCVAELLVLDVLNDVLECELSHLVEDGLSISVEGHTPRVALDEVLIFRNNLLDEAFIDLIVDFELISQDKAVLQFQAFRFLYQLVEGPGKT